MFLLVPVIELGVATAWRGQCDCNRDPSLLFGLSVISDGAVCRDLLDASFGIICLGPTSSARIYVNLRVTHRRWKFGTSIETKCHPDYNKVSQRILRALLHLSP